MAFPSDLVRTKNWGTEVLTDGDLEGQFDLIINWLMASLNGSTGHAHTGGSNQGQKIDIASCLSLTSQASGDMLYATSATVWARLAKGTAGQFFRMNAGATAPSWADTKRSFVMNERDTLGAGTIKGAIIRSPIKCTITGAYANVKTAPTGADLLVDINISTDDGANWTTVLGASKLTVSAGNKTGSKTSSFDVTAIAVGNLICMDIDQIGSTVAGADLTACLEATEIL